MKINNKTILLHSVIGGMTSDYFDFFCEECGSHINYVDFYGLDSVGVKLVTKCPKCSLISIFKIKTSIQLGPIETKTKYGKTKITYGYKTYEQRKLKSYKKDIESKISHGE